MIVRPFRASIALCATVLNLALPMLPAPHVHAAEAGETRVTVHRHHIEDHAPSPAASGAARPHLGARPHQHPDHRFAQVIAAFFEAALHITLDLPAISTTPVVAAQLTTGERPIAAGDERLNHGPPPPRTPPRGPPTYSA